MKEGQFKGYLRADEALFISVRHPQLSLVIHGGGRTVVDGQVIDSKPRFADFHPGPFGGELRVNLKKNRALAEALRERDNHNTDFIEVTSEDQLSGLSDLRDKIVADVGDRVVTKRAEKPPVVIREPLPETKAPVAPKAAKGPGRPARQPAVV